MQLGDDTSNGEATLTNLLPTPKGTEFVFDYGYDDKTNKKLETAPDPPISLLFDTDSEQDSDNLPNKQQKISVPRKRKPTRQKRVSTPNPNRPNRKPTSVRPLYNGFNKGHKKLTKLQKVSVPRKRKPTRQKRVSTPNPDRPNRKPASVLPLHNGSRKGHKQRTKRQKVSVPRKVPPASLQKRTGHFNIMCDV